MAGPAWMPLYIADYLRDTHYLTAEEHGAYLLLIMHYWATGGPLPDDHALLRKITGVGHQKWPSVAKSILPFFILINGKLTHKRIDDELSRSAQIIEQKRTNALKRWNRKDATALQAQCNGNDSHSHSHSHKEERPTDAAQTPPLMNGFHDAKTKLFREGLATLMRSSGRTEPSCRTLIGKWLKQCENDAAIVSDAIGKAENVANPVAYIRQILEKQFPTDDPGQWGKQ